MSALTFRLLSFPRQTVDLSSLTPDRLSGKGKKEIAAIELTSGNRKVPAGELFEISGSDATDILFRDACDKLSRIGQGMSGGSITVEGDAGAYLGIGMQNGRIKVTGNVGAWTGSGMANGEIHVTGNAGEFLGAAVAGDKQGMLGGAIIVEGDAGARAGDHMRRGMLLIKGNVGDYCGSRMLAGTIAVLGATGAGLGFGLKRGTLLLSQAPTPSATFNDCGTHDLAFLNLLHAQFRRMCGTQTEFAPHTARVRRFMGDLANDGKGEILVYI
jgi:formylmethanofuran dehydrogenase subunit C